MCQPRVSLQSARCQGIFFDCSAKYCTCSSSSLTYGTCINGAKVKEVKKDTNSWKTTIQGAQIVDMLFSRWLTVFCILFPSILTLLMVTCENLHPATGQRVEYACKSLRLLNRTWDFKLAVFKSIMLVFYQHTRTTTWWQQIQLECQNSH